MKILESAENYLETILILQKRNGTVRSIDIASELEYTKPSVSVAMKNLRENGYIEMDKMGHITLMDTGLASFLFPKASFAIPNGTEIPK